MAESKRDYYEVLGVCKDADEATLKKAYRQVAKKYHPDMNPGDAEAEKKFKEASEAYAVLSDPEKRRQYDQFGHAAFDGSAGAGSGSGSQGVCGPYSRLLFPSRVSFLLLTLSCTPGAGQTAGCGDPFVCPCEIHTGFVRLCSLYLLDRKSTMFAVHSIRSKFCHRNQSEICL